MKSIEECPSGQIAVEAIMREIRETAALKKIVNASYQPDANEDHRGAAVDSASTQLAVRGVTPRRCRIRLQELLAFYDKEFINNAYQAILNRDADATGASHYLNALRNGDLHKIEVLGRLRYSAEGKRENVKIPWLMAAFAFKMLTKVPLLGYLVDAITLPLRLPLLIRQMERREARIHAERARSEDRAESRWLLQEEAIQGLAKLLEGVVGRAEDSNPHRYERVTKPSNTHGTTPEPGANDHPSAHDREK